MKPEIEPKWQLWMLKWEYFEELKLIRIWEISRRKNSSTMAEYDTSQNDIEQREEDEGTPSIDDDEIKKFLASR